MDWYKEMDELMNDPGLFTDGRRNHDAVNVCICYAGLSNVEHIEDITADEVMNYVIKEHKIRSRWPMQEMLVINEHLKRIVPYLGTWYEDGLVGYML